MAICPSRAFSERLSWTQRAGTLRDVERLKYERNLHPAMGDGGQVEQTSTPREARWSVFVSAVGGLHLAADGLCLSLQQLVLELLFNGFP